VGKKKLKQIAYNIGIAEENKSERQGRERGTCEIGSIGAINVMHTNCTSQQREHLGQKREGEFNRSDSRVGFDYFQNFPTQSPICSGDDELPCKLDGITFPKWRNESIKAYGNAVVPALVLQIFKTIEKYNNS